MDLQSRTLEQQQSTTVNAGLSQEQKVEQLYHDIGNKQTAQLSQVLNEYPQNQRESIKQEIANAAANASGTPNPHITDLTVTKDGQHIVGNVNTYFPFKVALPEKQSNPRQYQTVYADDNGETNTIIVRSSRSRQAGQNNMPDDIPTVDLGTIEVHAKKPSQNFVGEAGDWVSENIADPIADAYRTAKSALADAVKIDSDDEEITKDFKRAATAVAGVGMATAESVGEGVRGLESLVEEGLSLAADKLVEKAEIGSEAEQRAAKQRSDAQLQTLSDIAGKAQETLQTYANNPEKIGQDISDGINDAKAGYGRFTHAVEQSDLNAAIDESKPVTDAASLLVGGAGLVKGGVDVSKSILARAAMARARAELRQESLREIGEWGKNKNLSEESFVYRQLPDSLSRENMDFDTFKTLSRTHMDDMTEEQIGQMKRIREDVPALTRKTVVTKVMPYEYLEGYLRQDNPYNTIGGFVARQVDTGHLIGQDLERIIADFALDYKKGDGSDSDFVQALSKGKNRYLVFEGKLETPEKGVPPIGWRFGGSHTDSRPCTLNGFVACRSDEIIPEFKFEQRDAPYPTHGSVLWVIENGEKRKAAVFDEREMKFVPTDEFKELKK